VLFCDAQRDLGSIWGNAGRAGGRNRGESAVARCYRIGALVRLPSKNECTAAAALRRPPWRRASIAADHNAFALTTPDFRLRDLGGG
jgi:hypothetical protein